MTLEEMLDQRLTAVLEGQEENDQAAASDALDEADSIFGEEAVEALVAAYPVAMALQGLANGYSRALIHQRFDALFRSRGGAA